MSPTAIARAKAVAAERCAAADVLMSALRDLERTATARGLRGAYMVMPDSGHVLSWDGAEFKVDGQSIVNASIAARVEMVGLLSTLFGVA